MKNQISSIMNKGENPRKILGLIRKKLVEMRHKRESSKISEMILLRAQGAVRKAIEKQKVKEINNFFRKEESTSEKLGKCKSASEASEKRETALAD